jgi:hypothetical protein
MISAAMAAGYFFVSVALASPALFGAELVSPACGVVAAGGVVLPGAGGGSGFLNGLSQVWST